MNILMLSIDNTLLGEQGAWKHGAQGDTIARHKKYGELVDRLDIVVTSPPGHTNVELTENMRVYPTNARTPYGHFRAVLKHTKSIHKNARIDLVVAQDLSAPAAYALKKKYKVPYLVSFHGADFGTDDWAQKRSDKLALPFIKRAVKYADGLRVVSHEMKTRFEKQGFAMPIEVIPTASDYSVFMSPHPKTQELREKYNSKKIILTNGRLVPLKNYPLLFDAIAELYNQDPSVQLLVIGLGPEESNLKKMIHEKQLSPAIELLGSMEYEELVPYYQLCDVFVLASDTESLGKVLLQAGAAAKPVVATNTLGARGIVQDSKTGFLVDVGDRLGLIERIQTLLTDPQLRERQGSAAREVVARDFNQERNINQFIDFWKQIALKK